MLSPDLELTAVEYAILLDEVDEAKRVLRGARTRLGAKRKKMRRLADLEFAPEAELSELIVQNRGSRPALVSAPVAPVAAAPSEPVDDLCDACDGSGIDTSDGVRSFCEACHGTGDRP